MYKFKNLFFCKNLKKCKKYKYKKIFKTFVKKLCNICKTVIEEKFNENIEKFEKNLQKFLQKF